MPIIKCFVSSKLETKFNSEYIDSVNSAGDQKFSEHADYVFCYFPKYHYIEDSKSFEPEVFVTKKKLESDPAKFRKYFEVLFKSKVTKSESTNSSDTSTVAPAKNIHEAWIESKLGKNWRQLIINFCEKFLKINSIHLNNDNDRLIIALTKDDWKKIKSKIKPEKVEKDLAKMYDENYNGSDLNLVELKKN